MQNKSIKILGVRIDIFTIEEINNLIGIARYNDY